MSNASDFAAKQTEIEAIPDEVTKSPNMPMDVYLQEAENTYQWCQADKEKLIAAGLDWTLVEDLPTRTGATRQAESLWFTDRFNREEAERLWQEKSPAAYDLRDQLLHDFHFAYRKLPELASRVSKIAEGNSHADMIQDLNDLAELGKANSEPLTKISFDLTLLDTAAATSDEMAELLSLAATDRVDNNETRVTRDKAYTYLKEAMDDIRECGQYVFWRDDQRFKGYVSQYAKRYNKNRKSDQESVPVEG
ncbi:MAG: hypothetical protein AB7T22_08460 [Calditrichaceae bacterium]